ncbi:MAG: helix-turn-helix domain-containing protein [Coriobacteriales bacterium]|nr:helix-turn-helix domain-containing protein [Coriobacteriales bacterium]
MLQKTLNNCDFELSVTSSKRTLDSVVLGTPDSHPTAKQLLCIVLKDALVCRSSCGALTVSGVEPAVIFNAVLEAFSHYREWQNMVTMAILNKTNWQTIMNFFNAELDRASYIINRNGRLLCLNKAYCDVPITEDWLIIAKTRMLNISAFKTMKEYDIGTDATISLVPDPSLCNYIQCTLTPYDPYELVLFILEYKEALNQFDLHMAQFLQEAVQLAHIDKLYEVGKVTTVFEQLANGKRIEPEEMAWSLHALKWQDLSSFRSLILEDKAINKRREHLMLVGQLLDALPLCVVFNLDDYIVVVFAQRDTPSILEKIEQFMNTQSRYCGVSASFCNWNLLYDSLKYCRAALALGKQRKKQIVLVDDNSADILSLLAAEEIRSFGLEHEVALVLHSYDVKHGTELLSTLLCYLSLNSNVADTARDMSIHRNTLGYRLEVIRKLTAFDLSDFHYNSHQRMHFIISAEMLLQKIL